MLSDVISFSDTKTRSFTTTFNPETAFSAASGNKQTVKQTETFPGSSDLTEVVQILLCSKFKWAVGLMNKEASL